MPRAQKVDREIQDEDTDDWLMVGKKLSLQIAEFGGTMSDLATRFALSMETVRDGIQEARRRGAIHDKEDQAKTDETKQSDESELLEATDYGYKLAEMESWKVITHRPGPDSILKKHEGHRRAVASLAAAKGLSAQTECEPLPRLLSELCMRMLGRNYKRQYLCEIKIYTNGKCLRHCPDLVVVYPESDEKRLPTVIEVLVTSRSEEELMSICKGWRDHENVGEVQLYATSSTIGAVWNAVRRTGTQSSTTVYTLPEPLEARALLELKPDVEPVVCVDQSTMPNAPSALNEDEELQLSKIIGWIGTWKAAGARAIAAKFKLTLEEALRLLEIGCARNLIQSKRLLQEDPIYHLTSKGARLTGVNEGFVMVRRNMAYLSRRAHVAAILSRGNHTDEELSYQVINPRCLTDEAPKVQVDVGGTVRPWEADVLITPRTELKQPSVAAVLITDYQPRHTLASLCKGWHSHAGVRRVAFYTISGVLGDLEHVIADAGLGAKLKAVPMPLSDYEKAEIRRQASNEAQSNRVQEHQKAQEEREGERRRWAHGFSQFCELTDEEWAVMDPILLPGRPVKPRQWRGMTVNDDREVINAILLCDHVGRNLRCMRITAGYASGPKCFERIEQWLEAEVWNLAWEKLVEISPSRELKKEFALLGKPMERV
jgi:transposase